MFKLSRAVTILFISTLAIACGGGGSSSGGGSNPVPVAPAPPPPPPPPTTQPGEFATDCMADIQLRRNRTALIKNICSFAINVRQTDSRFPEPSPVTEIGPGQLVAVPMGDDSLSVGLGACRVPSIPEPADPGFFTCTDVLIGATSKALVWPELRIN